MQVDYSGGSTDTGLLRITVGLVARFEDLGRYIFHVLLMRRRGLYALGRIELVVDDCVLLGPHVSGGSDLMYSTQRLMLSMRCS